MVPRERSGDIALVYLERYIQEEVGLDELKKVPASFYRTPAGTEPVREWLQGLERTDRQRIGADIATEGRMILLHGFMKKTRTTPARVLLIARNRQEEVGR